MLFIHRLNISLNINCQALLSLHVKVIRYLRVYIKIYSCRHLLLMQDVTSQSRNLIYLADKRIIYLLLFVF